MDLIDLGKLVLILQDQISSFEQLLLHHPDPEQLEMIDNQLKTANNTLDFYEKLSKVKKVRCHSQLSSLK